MTHIDFLPDMFPREELNLISALRNVKLQKKIFPATIEWEMIKLFSVLVLITHCEFISWHDMWSSRSQ